MSTSKATVLGRTAAAFCATGLATLLVSAQAHATPQFPTEIQAHLGLSYTPGCALCHSGGITNSSTVTTPFAVAMRRQGLVADNTTSLNTALDRLATAGTDSDQDGVADIDELRAATDPNLADGAGTGGATGGSGGSGGGSGAGGASADAGAAGAGGQDTPGDDGVSYGCSVGETRRPGSAAGLAALAFVVPFLSRRRRARAAGRKSP